jgi:SAM-dependent methyltransferase
MATPRPTQAETFLKKFHDRRPGLTSKAFSSLPVHLDGVQYPSTYHLLASTVAHTANGCEVLDLACGDGYLLSLIALSADSRVALYGIDMSFGELAAAATRLGSRATLTCGRAQELPYREGQFDAVLCHMALMLMEDLDVVLTEVRRTMRGKGTFSGVVGVPSPPSPALAKFIDVFSRYSRHPEWEGLRLGDPRLRRKDGLIHVLSPKFEVSIIEDLPFALRLDPESLCRWLLDMYDFDLLRPECLPEARSDLLRSLESERDADGKVEFRQMLRFFSAQA